MQKTVLLVVPYFYPEGGGLENYAFQLACRMPAYIFHVACLSVKNSLEKKHNLIIHRYKAAFAFSNTPIAPFFLFKLKKLIRQEKINLIHAHTPVPYAVDCAALASRITNIPLIITYHSASLLKQRFFIDLIIHAYMMLEKLCLRQAREIITVSPHINLEKRIKKYINKLSTITPGVDLTKFKPYPYQSGNYLLFIGPIKKAYRKKGLETLLVALKLVKQQGVNLKLKIAGVLGDDHEYYKKIINQAGLNKEIEFLGQLSQEQLIKEYINCQAVIIPSAADSEGMPTILFEAGAISRPVLASKTAGIPYVIKPGINGLLFSPGDIKQIAQTIISFLNNPERAKQMANRASALIRIYDWKNLATQYEEIYQKYI